MKAPLAPVVGEGRVELGRSMAPTAIDDQHALWVRFAEGRHHLMQILTPLLSIKVRHDFVEDFGGAILDRANDAESHPAGDADPGTILHPRLVFAGLLAVDFPCVRFTPAPSGGQIASPLCRTAPIALHRLPQGRR